MANIVEKFFISVFSLEPCQQNSLATSSFINKRQQFFINFTEFPFTLSFSSFTKLEKFSSDSCIIVSNFKNASLFSKGNLGNNFVVVVISVEFLCLIILISANNCCISLLLAFNFSLICCISMSNY